MLHEFFELRSDANADGVEFQLDLASDRGLLINAYLNWIGKRARRGVATNYPDYTVLHPGGHRNAVGLTKRGEVMVQGLMRKGMLIDVDHMSDLARDSVLDLAEGATYPVYSSHSKIRDLGLTLAGGDPKTLAGVRHEGMLSRATMERIKKLKGMVAPQTNMGPTLARDPKVGATPPTSHADTSLSWAQGYLYCTEVMGGPVAIGTDFNGFAQQPGPRGPGVGPARQIAYGSDTYVGLAQQKVLEKYRLGYQTFDFNELGLAHYGLLPDFLRDVANVIGDSKLLDPFFKSADRFIEMWELCEATSPTVTS